jgi:hypothetical protein
MVIIVLISSFLSSHHVLLEASHPSGRVQKGSGSVVQERTEAEAPSEMSEVWDIMIA